MGAKNQHTLRQLLNFENWTNGKPQYLAKIRVFKVDYFIPPLFLVPKLRSVAQNEWKKYPYMYILLLIQKYQKYIWVVFPLSFCH